MSRVSGTGIYGNSIIHHPQDETEFDIEARNILNGLGPSPTKLTPAQTKQAYQEALAADERRNTNLKNSEEFIALHGEWIDLDENAQRMNATLLALYGERAYTLDEFEQAYRVCVANNSLQLDQAELAKQAQAEANARAKVARAKRAAENRQFTESEQESMPLDELRQLANREIQKDMRKVAERGGYEW